MITALSTPAAGRLLLDSNNTVIKIQSSNGEGYYFRAIIYVNGVLFDEQGWSRSDAFTATKDLKKLLSSYFDPGFTPIGTTISLLQQPDFIKTINITVEEYNIENGGLEQYIDLPVFNIMYAIKPESFNDEARISILGIEPEVMVIPKTGIIVVPFYVKATIGESITAQLVTNAGTLLTNISIPATRSRGAYKCIISLSVYPLVNSVTHVTLTLGVGGNTVSKTYRINRFPDFPVKEIAFMNNYGHYIYAYPDGEMETESNFNVDSYETADGSLKVFEVNEEENYTINSGSYQGNELSIMKMIANALDCRIKIVGIWHQMITKTKKLNVFKDRLHVYSNDLLFGLKKGKDVVNIGMTTSTGFQPDIFITGHSISGNNVTVNFIYQNGYIYAGDLWFERKLTNASVWQIISVYVAGPGPITVNFPDGAYHIRLRPANSFDHISNTVTVTVE